MNMPEPKRTTVGMKRPASTTELARIASPRSSTTLELITQPPAQRRRLDSPGTSTLAVSLPGGSFPTSSRAAVATSLLGGVIVRPTTSSQRYAEFTRLGDLSQQQLVGGSSAAFRTNAGQPPMGRIFVGSGRPSALAIAAPSQQIGGAATTARGIAAYGRESPVNVRSRSSVASTSSDDNSNHSVNTSDMSSERFCPCKTAAQGRQEGIANRRLLIEMRQLVDAPLDGCQVTPREESILHWTAVIDGPKDTVYEGGTFFVELIFTERYPFQAPKIVFLTRIYHCNINSQGKVCMDPISRGWNSCMTISTILQSLISLLYACNPKDALVPCIADQFLKYPDEYEKMARIWTQRYAQ